jgi:menaquinol-cytochrome c reductase iron-sulfur subunit
MGRRSFLKWLTNGLGAVFAALLGIPALQFLTDPRNRPAAAAEFKRVARLSELVENVPKQVLVRNLRRDAWTVHPSDVIGRVWLIRRPGGDGPESAKVEAYTTVCPHLGGSINYEASSQRFVCPLHGATFNLTCQRVSESELGRPNVAPRDMDRLEVQQVADGPDGELFIEVKYENFVQGKEAAVKKS